jgi:D-beta-D-heptose 7-phosphate kinase/D-beta-D-heptose 1-phosphate adenosyltransferase
MENYRSKIKNISGAKQEIHELKKEGKSVVFTNGCFDILHSGHARYLYEARNLGDYLIVAVNSDRSVRQIKKEGRPIIPQNERAEMIAALGFVDAVVIFDEDTPLMIIEYLVPDILVKGGDWGKNEIVGSNFVEKSGGEVRRIPYISGYSTTEIIEKIRGIENS